MFFYLSKLLWLIAAPSNFWIAATLASAVAALAARDHWRRQARRLALFGALVLAALGFLPVGPLLLLPLENRFPRPDLAGVHPTGIVVLGGAIDEVTGARRGGVHLVAGADRLTAAVALARRFPDARIVYSGGSGALLGSDAAEAQDAKTLWISLGIAPERIAIEARSRNTYENAEFTRDLLRPGPDDRFILVTSAYHMPRAVGLFRKAGMNVTPFPVDYRTTATALDFEPMRAASDGLMLVDVGVREWIGLAAYYAAGRIDTLLPGP